MGLALGILVGPFVALSQPSLGEVMLLSVLISINKGPPPYNFQDPNRTLRTRVIRAWVIAVIVFTISFVCAVIINGKLPTLIPPAHSAEPRVGTGE